MMTLAVGFFIGVGGIIALTRHIDRENDNGCFYMMLIGLAGLAALAIVLSVS